MASRPEQGGGPGAPAEAIPVSVCYADVGRIWQRELSLPAGSTVADAIEASGFRREFPEVDPARSGTGVYGRRRPLEHVLHPHDRVEIYRPLVFDPKESRRRRAAHKAAAGQRAQVARGG
ncbi:RnfH family protein [Pigmentiphaga sp.]|uniref:RnfH family protein n=1 Tax=Pigmentiphaga sp. TaxID=1977564 RepID=UPI0025EF9637|nr:RnfH family protein [Pigmentiphaga sp.]MBX6317540.1 RnfH family protein [Pigmentiphaga sp.]